MFIFLINFKKHGKLSTMHKKSLETKPCFLIKNIQIKQYSRNLIVKYYNYNYKWKILYKKFNSKRWLIAIITKIIKRKNVLL